VVAGEDFQVVVSGAAEGVHSSDRNVTRIWLQLHSFLEFCVLFGSGICNSLTTKDTKVHKGKTQERDRPGRRGAIA
jgi:hypothetical protein